LPRSARCCRQGLKVKTGTIVDATIIGAPSSTKNATKQRDPEMHQTRKGQQWYFGMKLHIGVDSKTGLAHSAVVTAANVHDKHPLPDCCMAGEKPGLRRQRLRLAAGTDAGQGAQAKDFTNQRVRKGSVTDELEAAIVNRQVPGAGACRARVWVVKRLWGFEQGALPRPGQERHAGVHGAGLANIYLARTRRTRLFDRTSRCTASQQGMGGMRSCGSTCTSPKTRAWNSDMKPMPMPCATNCP
jgi:IS5 family transposase